MTSKKIVYLLTEDSGFFGQRMMPWESMSVKELKDHLSREFEVRELSYEQISLSEASLRGQIILHSSSQQPEYKQFVDDILLYLHELGNYIYPSIHATRCHENKGYQELYKKIRGVGGLKGAYFAKEHPSYYRSLEYPIVVKQVAGSGSVGVEIARDGVEISRILKPRSVLRLADIPSFLRSTVGHLFRKWVLRRENLRPYGDYYFPIYRHVLQEFVPNLSFDYKVIAFPKRMFVLKRTVRKSDFRASGSGFFEFCLPSSELLDFADELRKSFKEPFVSFDICHSQDGFKLIEFQATHFGPYTIVKSPFHFVKEGGGWVKRTISCGLEESIAQGFIDFVKEYH